MGARHKLALFSLFCYPRGLLAECEDLGNPQRGEECCPPNCNHRNRPLCKTIKVQSEASDTLTSLPKTDTPELSCTHLSQVSQVTQSEAPSPQSLFLQKPFEVLLAQQLFSFLLCFSSNRIKAPRLR